MSGLSAWLIQRLSALYLAVFTVYALVRLAMADSWSHAAWSDWLAAPTNAVTLWLAVLALLLHAWVGGRDVLLDYVHPLGLRVVMLTALAGWLLGSGIWFGATLLEVM
ncbi:succinate dehydrogenase, hydrophobic membrane anchor protein [Guyparkeria sp.]|uniref:succinate dehydrogenase, hydrophobic membrane anchor protein n=1 Tax=Guyparkeria sp. TaxID=2035736 RepID=UPI0039704EEA